MVTEYSEGLLDNTLSLVTEGGLIQRTATAIKFGV